MATDPQVMTRQVISRNPATGEVLATIECATEEEVRDAVARARRAQPAWAALNVSRRIGVLREFQRRLLNKKEEIARLITSEMGKPYAESLLSEVLVALDAARFCAKNARANLRPERVSHGNLVMKAKVGRLLREPYGVIGIIAPWNYPFSTPASEVMAALVTGNAVVLKPSEFTTLSAQRLVELLHESGVPREVLHLVVGDRETGAALVASSIDKLIFTGSVASGRKVAQSAAARFLPVVLELGGKDPMLVLDDADVNIAASGAVWGALMNAGQTCLSVERCYVHRSLYDRFVAACVEKAGKLTLGNGLDLKTDVGPMIHEGQLRIVEDQVEDARSRGARVLIGGARREELGRSFYAPTVIVDVDQSMRLMQEETFGPVLPIVPFGDDDEAVALANDSEFGLAASIFTSNRRRGEALAKRLEAGTVLVNDVVTGFAVAEAPHGGVKASGIGRTHGHLGMQEMIRPKFVDSDLLPRVPKLWWFGYGAEFARHMEGFIEFLFAKSWGRRLRGGIGSILAFKRILR